jgi:hypothetical protein
MGEEDDSSWHDVDDELDDPYAADEDEADRGELAEQLEGDRLSEP